MREIKFRAWDKENKTVRTVTCINFFDEYIRVDEDNSGSGDLIKLEDCVLMQYTGLKDKNGQDIYEGDIVCGEYGDVTSVEFSDYVGSCGCCYDEFFGTGFIVARTAPVGGELRVVGNIYLNSDLLKEDK